MGAGFDSFIVRQPAFARDLAIVEIDHPATQALKRRRLDECGVPVPPNVRFVAADLAAEPVADVLGRAGVSRTAPAFFAWLGVTVYLSRDANRATLAAIAAASAPGSELVFTYVDARVLDRLRAHRAAPDEPWVSGFDPASLPSGLAALGLRLVEDLDGTALAARYAGALVPGRAGHVARAEVRRPPPH